MTGYRVTLPGTWWQTIVGLLAAQSLEMRAGEKDALADRLASIGTEIDTQFTAGIRAAVGLPAEPEEYDR